MGVPDVDEDHSVRVSGYIQNYEASRYMRLWLRVGQLENTGL